MTASPDERLIHLGDTESAHTGRPSPEDFVDVGELEEYETRVASAGRWNVARRANDPE